MLNVFHIFYFTSPIEIEKSFVAASVLEFIHFRFHAWGTELSSLATHINKRKTIIIWQETLNGIFKLHKSSNFVFKASMKVKYFVNFDILKNVQKFLFFIQLRYIITFTLSSRLTLVTSSIQLDQVCLFILFFFYHSLH